MSSGVLTTRSMRPQNMHDMTVTTAAITAPIRTALLTYERILLKSLAPKACATGMAKPAQAPLQKPMIRNVTDDEAPNGGQRAHAYPPPHYHGIDDEVHLLEYVAEYQRYGKSHYSAHGLAYGHVAHAAAHGLRMCCGRAVMYCVILFHFPVCYPCMYHGRTSCRTSISDTCRPLLFLTVCTAVLLCLCAKTTITTIIPCFATTVRVEYLYL